MDELFIFSRASCQRSNWVGVTCMRWPYIPMTCFYQYMASYLVTTHSPSLFSVVIVNSS